jgi:crotonobetaine/carnitine-CoA ligase
MSNRPEAVFAWFGSVLAGAVYVPLHRGQRGAILADFVARSGAEVLLTERVGLRHLPKALPPVVLEVEDWKRLEAHAPLDGVVAAAPTDITSAMFTSGTTGSSKVVLIPHNQYCRGAAWVAWAGEMSARDRMHHWFPLFHIAGQLDCLLAIVVAGGSVALYPTFSASGFWPQIREQSATIFGGFTSLLEILLAMPERADDASCSLRLGLIGWVPSGLRERFERRFDLRLMDVYGMTEAEPVAFSVPGEQPPEGSCGRASGDFDVAILGEDGRAVAPGAVGEIALRPRAPGVMIRAYENDVDATSRAFADLWFRTGDLGMLDVNGHLFFRDRIKHVIRRRGENISSWELEHAIAEHPGIDSVAAVAVPSPLGEDDVKVVVVPADGETLDPADLRAWCEARLARFMCPRYVEIAPSLPLTDTGKVRKELLTGVGSKVWDVEVHGVSARG